MPLTTAPMPPSAFMKALFSDESHMTLINPHPYSCTATRSRCSPIPAMTALTTLCSTNALCTPGSC
eukprot:CAMPEP_0114165364 /NCGR_PEP_ID=MMETSP0043_2-20121206/31211_1 /TAXON_ID=464988 /ORGANISM="Hemiselmis andersenii, Strain CCMP644" /LENGTH=65 /DNA_ID=CAMNT_0001262185 /DNA_START=71 /DNA_END=265 /DNA_ORIENTATION=-